MTDPITHDGGVDRCWKLCRCVVCGVEAECTMIFDFYSEEVGGPLKCECCQHLKLSALGLDLQGRYHEMEPGVRVRVLGGLMKGHSGVVKSKGIMPTLAGTNSPPAILVKFPSPDENEMVIGKLAGDLLIVEEINA